MNSAGLCPHCERRGALGKPCDSPVCTRHGYQPIPEDFFSQLGKAPGPPDPLIGQAFGGHVLVRPLGKGGMGSVYLALQDPGTTVELRTAVKILNDEDPRTRERFRSEAAALAKLDHPNIVRFLRYGVDRERPYLAMEFVADGHTLEVAMSQTLPADAWRQVVAQTAHALSAAHDAGIVHRDVKPENIMIRSVAGYPWFVRLVDFGLAKSTDTGPSTKWLAGTYHYMAPEQFEARDIGPATDLYALGLLTTEILTGRRAYAALPDDRIRALKVDPEHDVAASLLDVQAPAEVRAFCRKAQAFHPRDRFASAAEFLAAFEAIAGALVPAPMLNLNEAPPTEALRRRTALVDGGVDAARKSPLEQRSTAAPRSKLAPPVVVSPPVSPAPLATAVLPAPPATAVLPAPVASDRVGRQTALVAVPRPRRRIGQRPLRLAVAAAAVVALGLVGYAALRSWDDARREERLRQEVLLRRSVGATTQPAAPPKVEQVMPAPGPAAPRSAVAEPRDGITRDAPALPAEEASAAPRAASAPRASRSAPVPTPASRAPVPTPARKAAVKPAAERW